MRTSLDISYNCVRDTMGLASLTALEDLFLPGNRLTALGPEFARLTALRRLDAGANKIRVRLRFCCFCCV